MLQRLKHSPEETGPSHHPLTRAYSYREHGSLEGDPSLLGGEQLSDQLPAHPHQCDPQKPRVSITQSQAGACTKGCRREEEAREGHPSLETGLPPLLLAPTLETLAPALRLDPLVVP